MDDPYIDNTTERSMNEQTRKALELARDALHHGGVMQTHKAIDAIDAALSAPAAAVAQPVWTPEECDRVMRTLRYLIGIAERGEGRQMRDDETAEQFVLGYVKRLEAQAAPASQPVSEREAFEAWWQGDLKDWKGHDSVPALHAWSGWQARAVLALRPKVQPRAPLTDEQIDAHLDVILRAAGSALRYYTMAKSRADMRAALASCSMQEAAPRAPCAPLTDDALWLLWNEQGLDDMSQQEAIAFARAAIAEFCEVNGIGQEGGV